MIITITPVETSEYEPVILRESIESNFPTGQTRMTRSKLIDINTYIEKRGTSYGDSTFTVVGRISKSQAETLEGMRYDQITLALSTPDRLYVGYIYSLNVTSGNMTMTFWPEGDLTEIHQKFQDAM